MGQLADEDGAVLLHLGSPPVSSQHQELFDDVSLGQRLAHLGHLGMCQTKGQVSLAKSNCRVFWRAGGVTKATEVDRKRDRQTDREVNGVRGDI